MVPIKRFDSHTDYTCLKTARMPISLLVDLFPYQYVVNFDAAGDRKPLVTEVQKVPTESRTPHECLWMSVGPNRWLSSPDTPDLPESQGAIGGSHYHGNPHFHDAAVLLSIWEAEL